MRYEQLAGEVAYRVPSEDTATRRPDNLQAADRRVGSQQDVACSVPPLREIRYVYGLLRFGIKDCTLGGNDGTRLIENGQSHIGPSSALIQISDASPVTRRRCNSRKQNGPFAIAP